MPSPSVSRGIERMALVFLIVRASKKKRTILRLNKRNKMKIKLYVYIEKWLNNNITSLGFKNHDIYKQILRFHVSKTSTSIVSQ